MVQAHQSTDHKNHSDINFEDITIESRMKNSMKENHTVRTVYSHIDLKLYLNSVMINKLTLVLFSFYHFLRFSV